MTITIVDGSRGTRPRRPVLLPLAAATLLSLAACGSGPDDGRASAGTPAQSGGAASSANPPAPTAATPAGDEPAVGNAAIRVRIGDTVLMAHLRGVPASRDLIAQLPLTLTFRDLNSVEKIAQRPRELSMSGVPAGDDPAPHDIGYYAPSGDLVLYYGDVGYFTGIVRLGRFDGTVEPIQNQTGDFQATVELVNG